MRTLAFITALCGILAMAACGGGGNNGGGGGSSITSVTVTCSPATVSSAATSNCSASVNGTGNFSSVVTWAASQGTISSSGVYTAPSVSSTTQVTITATSTQDSSKSGTATVTVTGGTTTSNVVPLIIDAGPKGSSFSYVNGAFASVTVCVPGTSNCQTIDHMLVDTGSSGLRIISSLLTIQLPGQKDANGDPIGECTQFADGYSWGNVASADVQLAGETASSVPIQLIGTTTLPNIPTACSSTGTAENDVSSLGANGILGVGLFEQDCGGYCATTTTNGFYYTCPSNNCTATVLSLTSQVQNPVSMFAQDNNGVLIQLPSVPTGTGSVNPTGSLIIGVDTQSNNALGNAMFFTTTAVGDFSQTTFNSQNYPDTCSSDNKGNTTGNCSYLDSGSNGWFILNANTLGVTQCSGQNKSFYCQNPTKTFTATVNGTNGSTAPIQFSIGDADTLFSSNPNSTAFVELGGPGNGSSSTVFDFGLPFFYGKSVFTVIENHTASKGSGPAWAF